LRCAPRRRAIRQAWLMRTREDTLSLQRGTMPARARRCWSSRPASGTDRASRQRVRHRPACRGRTAETPRRKSLGRRRVRHAPSKSDRGWRNS
jgi:hypothetical protein